MRLTPQQSRIVETFEENDICGNYKVMRVSSLMAVSLPPPNKRHLPNDVTIMV
jgi:hypothetical protein